MTYVYFQQCMIIYIVWTVDYNVIYDIYKLRPELPRFIITTFAKA